MKKKYQILIAFLFVVAVQVYVPASMILDNEDILITGKTFKFLVEPIDPNDPMRGKYITLRFKENTFTTTEINLYDWGEDIFVILDKNPDGYAEIQSLSKEIPHNSDFVEAKIWSISIFNDTTSINISYPFDRFYMDEFLAPKAEIIYNESLGDSLTTTYALVKIKEGKAVLKDVMIDEKSIKDMISK